jgi:hypothetical protein
VKYCKKYIFLVWVGNLVFTVPFPIHDKYPYRAMNDTANPIPVRFKFEMKTKFFIAGEVPVSSFQFKILRRMHSKFSAIQHNHQNSIFIS